MQLIHNIFCYGTEVATVQCTRDLKEHAAIDKEAFFLLRENDVPLCKTEECCILARGEQKTLHYIEKKLIERCCEIVHYKHLPCGTLHGIAR